MVGLGFDTAANYPVAASTAARMATSQSLSHRMHSSGLASIPLWTSSMNSGGTYEMRYGPSFEPSSSTIASHVSQGGALWTSKKPRDSTSAEPQARSWSGK